MNQSSHSQGKLCLQNQDKMNTIPDAINSVNLHSVSKEIFSPLPSNHFAQNFTKEANQGSIGENSQETLLKNINLKNQISVPSSDKFELDKSNKQKREDEEDRGSLSEACSQQNTRSAVEHPNLI